MQNLLKEFTNPAELIAEFDKAKADGSFFIVYLTGGIGPEGKSWCPDCDAHRDAIKTTVLDKTELLVLKGVVDDRNTWVGVSDHPYKAHPIIKAGGVQSLTLHMGAQVMSRIDSDTDFQNEELLKAIACPE